MRKIVWSILCHSNFRFQVFWCLSAREEKICFFLNLDLLLRPRTHCISELSFGWKTHTSVLDFMFQGHDISEASLQRLQEFCEMQCFLSGSLVETGLLSGVTSKADLWKILQSNRPLLSGKKARTGVGTTPRMGVADTGGPAHISPRAAKLSCALCTQVF